MKRSNFLYVLMLAGWLITSCDDVFEEDISDEKITLIFPKNDAVLENTTINFQWEDIEDITEFRLNIRDVNGQIVSDTLVNAISFSNDLEEGEYCWRVRGENFTSKTDFSEEACFTISAPVDLSEVTLNLLSPDDNASTNTRRILFRWELIENATVYRFRLIKLNGDTEEVVFENSNLNRNEIQFSGSEITEDGEFMWEVEAINTVNESRTPVVSRVFLVDATAPSIPILTRPDNNSSSTSGSAITLAWSFAGRISTQDETVTSILQISENQNFVDFEVNEMLNVTTFTFTPSGAGTFFWRVMGVDGANNEGDFSETRSFTVN